MGELADFSKLMDEAVEALNEGRPLPAGILIHVDRRSNCNHEWGGWREFEDGRSGEQVCKKCGCGAMQATMWEDF